MQSERKATLIGLDQQVNLMTFFSFSVYDHQPIVANDIQYTWRKVYKQIMTGLSFSGKVPISMFLLMFVCEIRCSGSNVFIPGRGLSEKKDRE